MSTPFRVFRPPHGDDCWVCREEQAARVQDTDYDEAGESWRELGVARGALTAFYIVCILMAGVYVAGIVVRHWPHG